MVYSEDGFNRYVQAENLDPNQFKPYFVIKESLSYYAFHKDTPDELILKFQAALDKVKAAGKHAAISKKYLP